MLLIIGISASFCDAVKLAVQTAIKYVAFRRTGQDTGDFNINCHALQLLHLGLYETMILFLDFDGVLHPQYEDQPVPADVAFCHLPQFEAVIREFPAVEIVISSTWREQFSLANLRSRFSPDIASRIIGTTLLAKDQVTPRLVERREWEIVAWITVQGRSNEPWIALDDAAWQFKHHRDHLVACTGYLGLDSNAEFRLRAALAVA